MKKLRIHMEDLGGNTLKNYRAWFEDQYEIEYTREDPDFILHSCFGNRVLNYSGVRLAVLGENLQPDFNISDYATGFGRIEFGDRYRRIPNYRWHHSWYEPLFDKDRLLVKVDGLKELQKKSRFCTLVISNRKRGDYFDKFLPRLAEYKSVDSGGRWQNNIGGPVEDKKSFLSSGKFHVAFENTSSPGYITEKILHAFASRTIPIYWGAPDVGLDFNPEAFIDCRDFDSVDSVVREIERVDSDDKAYISMLEKPMFADGKEPAYLREEKIVQWFKSIFDQPKDQAYRRNRFYWGELYEARMKEVFFPLHKQAYAFWKDFFVRAQRRIRK